MQRETARQREKPKKKKTRKGAAAEEPAGARDAEIDAGLAALDEQSRELHAIALDMCDEIAETTVRLHEHARRVDAQTAALAQNTRRAAV